MLSVSEFQRGEIASGRPTKKVRGGGAAISGAVSDVCVAMPHRIDCLEFKI